jgi:hypothetical protein
MQSITKTPKCIVPQQHQKLYHNALGFLILVCLLEDGSWPPKYVGVDWYHVYVFVCANCWSYKIIYISLHGMNNIKMYFLCSVRACICYFQYMMLTLTMFGSLSNCLHDNQLPETK